MRCVLPSTTKFEPPAPILLILFNFNDNVFALRASSATLNQTICYPIRQQLRLRETSIMLITIETKRKYFLFKGGTFMELKLKELFGQIKNVLLCKGVTPEDINKIEQQIQDKIKNIEAPTIAIIGFTGVGKSSTLNALFNAGQPTSDVRACTQDAKQFTGNLEPYTGKNGIVNIYDMPGLGESIAKDKIHYDVYAKILPVVDVIIWTFHAEDRAMTPMQNALLTLVEKLGSGFTHKLLFAINKADAIAPGESEWNTKFNIPSNVQRQNLDDFEAYIRERIHEVLPSWNGPIISYSAKRRYHLDQLMTAMIEVMPKDRKWVLNNLADVADYSEFIAPEYLEYIKSIAKDLQ